jgi:hypothetical protein
MSLWSFLPSISVLLHLYLGVTGSNLGYTTDYPDRGNFVISLGTFCSVADAASRKVAGSIPN